MEDKRLTLSAEQAITYIGGASTITATLISAITGLIKTVYSMGQDIGSSLKRLVNHQNC